MIAVRRALPILALILVATSLLVTMQTANVRAVSGSGEPEHKLWGVYWNVQSGFTSTLEMKNNRVSETVTAHVSLYFASGEEYYLRPVVLSPRQTAVIDLNRAIASLPRAVAGRASREGTIEVAFDSGNASAIMASVSVKNPDRGIAWNFFLYPDGYWSQDSPSPLQSAFWLPNEKADGFIAIQNVSNATTVFIPRLHVNGAIHEGTPTSLLAGQGFKLELRRELRRLGLDQVGSGGTEIAYQGTPGAILAHGVLFDNQGYSAEMDFLPETTVEESTDFFYRTPRLALGPADPALNLPERTKFKPTLVLHNFKGYPVSLNLSFGPSSGSTPTPATIPVQLAARETRVMELASSLERLGATGPWASLEVSYSGTHSKLGMMLVSVSEDGKHSIRSVLNWVEAAIREGWYWQADDNTNTLLGILNSDTEAATVRMSLDYYVAGQRHSYELPDMSIAARSSALVDIGQVVASGTPDSDGDVIPPGVTFGGYRVRKTAPRFANITTEVLIVDRREKTFLSVYNTGCCYDWPETWPPSISGTPGTNGWLAVQSFDSCTSEPVDFVNNPPLGVRVFFNSDNSSVADINSQGNFTMVEPGATTLRSTSVFPYAQQLCQRKTAGGTCSVTVNPLVTFGAFSVVGKDNTATVQVTLTPSSSSVPVTLTIAPTSGSGSAQFTQNNSTTLSITETQSVEIRGVTPSSTSGNMRLQAKVNSTVLATRTFTVVEVLLSLRTQGVVSADNAARAQYISTIGSDSLGTIFASAPNPPRWITGVEIVGTVTPSNLTSNVVLVRTVTWAQFVNMSQIGGGGPEDDTSFIEFRDDNPQSGGSNGKVYDLDGPGVANTLSEGTIVRFRLNFTQWAEIGQSKVSANLDWFSATSVLRTAGGQQLALDVSGDNRAGTGTISLTWNLQP